MKKMNLQDFPFYFLFPSFHFLIMSEIPFVVVVSLNHLFIIEMKTKLSEISAGPQSILITVYLQLTRTL